MFKMDHQARPQARWARNVLGVCEYDKGTRTALAALVNILPGYGVSVACNRHSDCPPLYTVTTRFHSRI